MKLNAEKIKDEWVAAGRPVTDRGNGYWTGNSGQCRRFEGAGIFVKIIESGHGEYANDQRAPTNWSDDELRAIARQAVEDVLNTLSAGHCHLPIPTIGRYLNGVVKDAPGYHYVEMEIPSRR